MGCEARIQMNLNPGELFIIEHEESLWSGLKGDNLFIVSWLVPGDAIIFLRRGEPEEARYASEYFYVLSAYGLGWVKIT